MLSFKSLHINHVKSLNHFLRMVLSLKCLRINNVKDVKPFTRYILLPSQMGLAFCLPFTRTSPILNTA